MTDVYRTPDERFEGLEGFAWEPHYTELEGDLAGLRMHHIEEGEGDPILLLHGEPTWAYLYRKMVSPLAGLGRVIAPDLIGFGRSDKVTDPAWYSYERHVGSLRQLIASLSLRRLTLVVQDWGGPIGLRLATESPENVARLVILNTGVFRPGPAWPSPGFLAWKAFVDQNPDLPVGTIVQGGTVTDLSPEVIRGYEAPWPEPRSKAGVTAFPGLVPLTESDPGAKEMMKVGDKLREWDKPTLVAFSDSDPIFPEEAGRRLAARIPGSVPFQAIKGAGHFLQEDRGEAVAEVISRFVSMRPHSVV
jgi:haloalkane dehalogenase